jgi:hypothetical protein
MYDVSLEIYEDVIAILMHRVDTVKCWRTLGGSELDLFLRQHWAAANYLVLRIAHEIISQYIYIFHQTTTKYVHKQTGGGLLRSKNRRHNM